MCYEKIMNLTNKKLGLITVIVVGIVLISAMTLSGCKPEQTRAASQIEEEPYGTIVIWMDAAKTPIRYWNIVEDYVEISEDGPAYWDNGYNGWDYIHKGVDDTLIVQRYFDSYQKEEIISEFALSNVPVRVCE
jgi:hypothetical protein